MRIPKRHRTPLIIFAIIMLIGAFFSPDEPSTPSTPPATTRPETALSKRHNGVTGKQFVDFCKKSAPGELLQNPTTAVHPNLLQRNDPYISASGDWAWTSWVEGSNLYGIKGRIAYTCFRGKDGKVTIQAVR